MDGSREVVQVIAPGGRAITVRVHEGKVMLPKGFSGHHPAGGRGAARKLLKQVKVPVLRDTPDYSPSAVVKRLVDVLGSNTVASLLNVSADRPGRWASGKDNPSAENRAQLADLEALVSTILAAFTPAQATLWLEGQDPHLGAKPLDVYRIRGSAPLISAIRAFEQGAFA
jgi:hypothetical protein